MIKLSSRLLPLVITGVLIGTPFLALASEFKTGNAPAHPKGETLLSDLYMLGGSITSSGLVKGDLVTLGGNILVNGLVTADLAAGGGTITVLSDVGDDVRAIGGTVVIQGQVGGDVIAGGGQVTISSPKVGGDVVAGGGVVRIDAPVGGNVHVAGSDVRIDSDVHGNLDVQAEQITLGPKARIFGTFSYKSPKEASLETGAVVVGKTEYTKSPDVREAAKLGLVAFFSIWFVAKMFMVFSGALVIGYVFQRYAETFVKQATKNPLAEFGRGVVFLIVTPIISVLLLFTVIGIAFGALGLLGYAAFLILGTMLAPLLIGSEVHKRIFRQHEYEISWKTILTGTLLYFIAGQIPYVGFVITSIIVLICIGATLRIKGNVLGEWR